MPPFFSIFPCLRSIGFSSLRRDISKSSEVIRQLSNLTAMPEAHSKLSSLLSKPDAEFDLNHVAKTLELDAALSPKVKSCAPIYRCFSGFKAA